MTAKSMWSTNPTAKTGNAQTCWGLAHFLLCILVTVTRPGSVCVLWKIFLCQVSPQLAQFLKPDKKSCFLFSQRHLTQKNTPLCTLFFPATFVTLQLPAWARVMEFKSKLGLYQVVIHGSRHFSTTMNLDLASKSFSTQPLTQLGLRLALEIKL